MEGDFLNGIISTDIAISIHALRMEGDRREGPSLHPKGNFNPRPPHGGRHELDDSVVEDDYISIHALRMEGDQEPLHPLCGARISIHALRMEGDLFSTSRQYIGGISIHALRMEGDYHQH